MLLHTKQLFDSNYVNCSVRQKAMFSAFLRPIMIVCYVQISVLLCFIYVAGNWMGVLG